MSEATTEQRKLTNLEANDYATGKIARTATPPQNNVLRKQKAHVLPKHCCAKGKIVDATVQQHTAPPLTAVRGGGAVGKQRHKLEHDTKHLEHQGVIGLCNVTKKSRIAF